MTNLSPTARPLDNIPGDLAEFEDTLHGPLFISRSLTTVEEEQEKREMVSFICLFFFFFLI
jgi:hypothetical protein